MGGDGLLGEDDGLIHSRQTLGCSWVRRQRDIVTVKSGVKMGEMVDPRYEQVLKYLNIPEDDDAWNEIAHGIEQLWSVLGKIEKLLNNDVNYMSREVMENMGQIRNLVYTFEDALEMPAILIKNERKRGITRLLRRCFGRADEGSGIFYSRLVFNFVISILEVRQRIKWLHDTFPEPILESDISTNTNAKRFIEWSFEHAAHRRSLRLRRPMYAHGMERHFVERKEDLDTIVNMVTQHQVVWIWGAKGLGKTNLARRVYLKSEVRNKFNAFAWVRLRQDDQIDYLLRNILNQLDAGAVETSAEEKGKLLQSIKELKTSAPEHNNKGAEEKKQGAEEQPKSSTEETMMDQLKEILRKKKCFIVIDGVSKSSQCPYISSEFLAKDANTRFLLITEEKELVGVGFSHELRCLEGDEGWELLQKYAFRGKKPPDHLDLGLMPKLGKEMVQKCDNLPSKISIIGRTLSEMPSSVDEWQKVNDVVDEYLKGKDDQSESSNDLGTITHICNRRPYRKKQCFLYLGMFKEDEGVDPEDLSFLWMAEGMVSPQKMETTEYYLLELESMLHVQLDEMSTNRRFISLQNLAKEISLQQGEREDFRLKVVDFSGGKKPRFDSYTLSEERTRRLVIHFNKLSSPMEQDLNATEILRSLLFLNSDRDYVDLPVRIPDFSEFLLLRVLHFVRCKFKGRELPQGIWKLFNLKYFGVLYCDLDKLPPSITNFRNLQVLNVRSYDDSKIVIPNVISEMVSLKHVRLPSNLEHKKSDKKLKLDGLLDLETLDGFNADIHHLDSLSKLEKLRHFSAHAYSNASLESIIKLVKSHDAQIQTNLVIESKCDLTSPEAMPVLEELLMSNLNALTFSMVVMRMFPNCRKSASEHLTEMKLIGCKLSEDPMEALGKFPNLWKLCLGYGAFVGKMMAIRNGGFPNLEYLEFRCLPNLEEWNVDKEAMKKLSTLIVTKCPKLKGIPDELTSLTSLNNMEIELPPTALPEAQYNIYMEKFGFVKNCRIRPLHDPLQSSGAH